MVSNQNFTLSGTLKSFSKKYRLILSLIIIGLFTSFERCLYYSLSSGINNFSNDIGIYDKQLIYVITQIFIGSTYLLSEFMGALADVKFGRYNVIIVGILFDFFGSLLLYLLSRIFNMKEYKMPLYVSALIVISIGTSCIKANAPIFGCLQMKRRTLTNLQNFFLFYFYAINVGGFVGNLMGGYFTLTFGLHSIIFSVLISSVLCLLVMAIGLPFFRQPCVNGTMLLQVLWEMKQAMSGACDCLFKDRGELNGQFRVLRHALYSEEMTKKRVVYLRNFLFWIALMVLYYAVYYQLLIVFTSQSLSMISIKDMHWHELMLTADNLNILFLLPWMAPLLVKYRLSFTIYKRMGVGICFCGAAIVSTIILEKVRHRGYYETSVAWQIPQYFLLGISEILTMPSGHEFAFLNATYGVEGLMMGIFTLTWGFGSLLGLGLRSLVVQISKSSSQSYIPNYQCSEVSWIESDLNCAHSENYLLILLFVTSICFLFYIVFALRSSCPWYDSIEAERQGQPITVDPFQNSFHGSTSESGLQASRLSTSSSKRRNLLNSSSDESDNDYANENSCNITSREAESLINRNSRGKCNVQIVADVHL